MADLITSYAFLGTLTNRGSDIFKFVYVPLCKRCLSEYVTSVKTDDSRVQGNASDVATYIKKDYSIDIPVIVVRKLLLAISKELSRKEKKTFNFIISNDGNSFECENFVFNDLEEEYQRQKRNSNKLQTEFERYVKEQSISDTEVAPFADFIKRYQRQLKGFFSSSHELLSEDEIENSYLLHAHFLQYVEKNDDALYKVCLKIYIGAIIATFLETQVEVSQKQKSKVVYYLDTSLILSALDLQACEATKPARDLLRLINKTGGVSCMLDVTQSEVKSILDWARGHWDDKQPRTKVNEACLRTQKKLSHIMEVASDLPQYVLNNLGVNYQQIENKYKDDFSSKSDVDKLKELRWRKGSALPDVIAYLYVRQNRGSNCDSVAKANYWFVTGNTDLAVFNKQNSLAGCVQEVITIDALTCMLFVQNPRDYEHDVSIIGLHSIIAQTIAEETIDKELLEEFRERLEEVGSISEDKYEKIMATVSEESPKKLRHLTEDSDSKQFGEYVTDVLKHHEEREKKRQEKDEQAQKEHDLLSQQLKDSEKRGHETERKLQEENEIIKKQSEELDEHNKKNEELERCIKSHKEKIELLCWGCCVLIFIIICLTISPLKCQIITTYNSDGIIGLILLSLFMMFMLASVIIKRIQDFCKSNKRVYFIAVLVLLIGLWLMPSLDIWIKGFFAIINGLPWACASFFLNLIKYIK